MDDNELIEALARLDSSRDFRTVFAWLCSRREERLLDLPVPAREGDVAASAEKSGRYTELDEILQFITEAPARAGRNRKV